MNPIEFLKSQSPGFASLLPEELQVLSDFVFLWSFVEAKAFDGECNGISIKVKVKEWGQAGAIQLDAFADCLAYFRKRYFENGDFTYHYSSLGVRSPDKAHVVPLLKGESVQDSDAVVALLLIVFRLRNNLFHGNKWSYELQGQLNNFKHANLTLMLAYQCHERKLED